MEQHYVRVRDIQSDSVSKAGIAARLVVLLAIATSLGLALIQLSPPAPQPEGAPVVEFSSGRARKHVNSIAQKPHPVGSSEHQRVRDYILGELSAIGLKPQIQKSQFLTEYRGELTGASIENIMVNLPGMSNTKSVLLVAHYDSVPTSPGASDDGSGVATLLETARALRAGPPLKNDLLLLFTDAEEVGLLGAKAFVEGNVSIEGIGVVLNFEARGRSGASIMFETSDGNGRLIDQFAKISPYPVASSFSNEIYRRLPNDTDFSVFKEAGLPGLNFAYINGLSHYHTALDTSRNLDERSLQHHGSYALELARHFGNLDVAIDRAEDLIYFNIIGSIVIRYSKTFAVILAIIDTLFFLAVTGVAIKRKLISIPGVLLALTLFLASTLITAIGVSIAWQVIVLMQRQYMFLPNGWPYNAELYLIGMMVLAISIFSALYALFKHKFRMQSLSIGALLCWLILTWVMTLFITGGSYLFAWPLLFALISAALLVRPIASENLSLKVVTAISILVIPGMLVVVPMIYLLFTSLGLEGAEVIVVFEVMLLGLLIPHLNLLARGRRWMISGLTAPVAFGFVLLAVLTPKFDKEHPKANNIFYVLNADSGKAAWASFDQKPDEWTSQFLSSNVSKGGLVEYAPISFEGFLKNEAPPLPLSPPKITPLSDSTKDGVRTLRLQLVSTRRAPLILASIEPDSSITNVRVNGKRLNSDLNRQWRIRYFGAGDEGIELVLEIRSPKTIKIRAMDVAYQLPEVPGFNYGSRPGNIIASPRPFSDSTLVSASFSF
jgi:Peptidase family M28